MGGLQEDAITDALSEGTTSMMEQQVTRHRGHAWASPKGGEVVLISSSPEEGTEDQLLATQPCTGEASAWGLAKDCSVDSSLLAFLLC